MLKHLDKQSKKLMVGVWDFLKEYAVAGVAIGMIFAQSAKDFVDAVVKGVFIPLLNLIIPGAKLENLVWQIGSANLNLGSVISSGLTFVIVILFLYVVVKKLLKNEKLQKMLAEKE